MQQFLLFQKEFSWLYRDSFGASGGVESDGPPKKLFVAGVIDPASRSSYTVKWEPLDATRRCWIQAGEVTCSLLVSPL